MPMLVPRLPIPMLSMGKRGTGMGILFYKTAFYGSFLSSFFCGIIQ